MKEFAKKFVDALEKEDREEITTLGDSLGKSVESRVDAAKAVLEEMKLRMEDENYTFNLTREIEIMEQDIQTIEKMKAHEESLAAKAEATAEKAHEEVANTAEKAEASSDKTEAAEDTKEVKEGVDGEQQSVGETPAEAEVESAATAE